MRALRGILAATVLVALLGGVPWALVRYIGWPLPDRVPTWAELQAILTTPIGTSLLVDVLAVLCWLAWVAFLIDIIRAVPAAVHAARRGVLESAPAGWRGPLHGLAAVLVTAVAVAVLAYRPPPESSTTFAAEATTQAVADGVQLVTSTPPASSEVAVRSVVVREPRDGVHDCLWRIADRELGDGARWPEIYQLNQGRPQADGRSLADPNLIYPGWVLVLPDTSTPEAPADRPDGDDSGATEQPPQPATPTPTTSSPRPTVTPSSPAPPNRGETSTDTTPADTDTTPPTAPTVSTDPSRPSWPPGIDLGPGAYIGMGLAAAISAALLVARRRRRRWYPPSSGFRADLPVAPVVRTLQVARLSYAGGSPGRTGEPEPTRDGAPLPTSPGGRAPSWPRDAARPTEGITDAGLPVGVHDDHRVVMDLARNRGLGLVGPGAADVARALLVTQLTTNRDTTTTRVLIPADDAEYLFEQRRQQEGWPTTMCVVANLDIALDHVEAHIRRAATDVVATVSIDPLVVLIATPRPETSRRLQVALDNGSTMGVAGVLLGQWRPGATIQVRGDGTVNATNPGPAQHLRGARLFTLPAPQATDLLALLHDTETPASPSSVTSDQDTDADDDPASLRASPATAPSPNDSTQHEATDDPATAPLSWSVLGPPRLTWHLHTTTGDLTTALTPRQRDLLVYLALHPDGVPRHTLADTLWPHSPTDRPANALHTTLSRLRRTLRAATSDDALAGLVTARGDRYQLDPDLVDVDYWHLARAVNRSRAAADTDRAAADQEIITCYGGELAADMTADWLDVPREAARRDAIDAAARLARTHIDTDPEQALHLLEQACGFDPYNELIYRDIMRLQARLGHRDAISRTLTLLATRLAELDEHPDPATVALARDFQHPRSTSNTT